jgi:heme/copper-type cytochrome/quinol oxidase subunit 4
VLSLVLTFGALGLGVSGLFSFGPAMFLLMVLACLQIAVQLFFFMHFLESDGPKYHIIGLAFGVIFTFAIVAGSIWIMTFNAQVS